MEAWSPIWMESNLTEYWLNHHICVSNIYILLQILSINKDRAFIACCHHKYEITSFWSIFGVFSMPFFYHFCWGFFHCEP